MFSVAASLLKAEGGRSKDAKTKLHPRLIVKVQDIGDPSLTVKMFKTSMTLAKNFTHFLPGTA
jgi:hypothetical protein